MDRRHTFQLILLVLCGSLFMGSTEVMAEGKIAVIVSSQAPIKSINNSTLRSIYLKKIFLSKQGQALIPVNLPADDPLRRAFSRSTIHMSDHQLRNYWNRRYFQGISPPYVLGSQEAVVRFVANTPGAIGYVDPCYLNPSVHQVLLLPATHTPDSSHCPAPSDS